MRRNILDQVSESYLENFLTAEIAVLGGLSVKFISPGRRGGNDRIVIMPGNKVFFVEMKKPGGTVTKLQQSFHHQLRKRGCSVHILHTEELIKKFIDELRKPA